MFGDKVVVKSESFSQTKLTALPGWERVVGALELSA